MLLDQLHVRRPLLQKLLLAQVLRQHLDGDALVAFTSCTAHWSDVGGVVAGSLNVHARSHFEEGVRIPALTLCKRGAMNNDIVAILMHNMRQSWERLGDLNAQVAAVRRGGGRIESLVKRYGSQTVLDAMEETQNYSERMARASFRALPDGDYYAEDQVDEDVYTGEPKTVRLKLSISGDHAVFEAKHGGGRDESEGVGGWIDLQTGLEQPPLNQGQLLL